MERSYTVKEIDDLRRCVEDRILFGTCVLPRGGASSGGYREQDLQVTVEQRVRTHMLAGHTAQDLIEADTPKETANVE
jgi:hypothetical protein